MSQSKMSHFDDETYIGKLLFNFACSDNERSANSIKIITVCLGRINDEWINVFYPLTAYSIALTLGLMLSTFSTRSTWLLVAATVAIVRQTLTTFRLEFKRPVGQRQNQSERPECSYCKLLSNFTAVRSGQKSTLFVCCKSCRGPCHWQTAERVEPIVCWWLDPRRNGRKQCGLRCSCHDGGRLVGIKSGTPPRGYRLGQLRGCRRYDAAWTDYRKDRCRWLDSPLAKGGFNHASRMAKPARLHDSDWVSTKK